MLVSFSLFLRTQSRRVFQALRSYARPTLVFALILGVIAMGSLARPAWAQQTVQIQNDLQGALSAGTSSVQCGGSTLTGGAGAVGVCLLSVVTYILTAILSIVVFFLGKIIVLLTSVLIVFIRYNGFNQAQVVQVGWVVVRDVVNMFFIIMLLVSAFMTIVGQGEGGWHYEKMIPRILVAAVLVNFSKTIVMLAIDASQVVMLTFVSAFQGQIAGNFIQATGMAKALAISDPGSAQNQGASSPDQAINMANICIAYLLAIAMGIVSIGTLLILIVFFIGRILSLWVLLIVSPAAFFVQYAGPTGALGKGIGKVSGDFWPKLTELLTGGPIAVFFLWLSFAIVQGSASSIDSGGLVRAAGFDLTGVSDALGTISAVGNTQSIASFIIGIGMMMIGLKAATSASGQVGGVAGSIGKSLESYTNQALNIVQRPDKTAAKLGRAGLTLTKKVGGVVASGAVKGYNMADKKYNLTGSLASEANNMFGNAPVIGHLTRPAIIAGMQRRSKLLKEDDAKLNKRMEGFDQLTPEQQVEIAKNLPGDGGFNAFFMPELVRKQHKILSDEKNRKQLMKNYEEEAKKELETKERERIANAGGNPAAELSKEKKDEISKGASAMALTRLEKDERTRIAELEEAANLANDKTTAGELKKQREANLERMNSQGDYDGRVKDILGDPGKIKELDASNMNSGRFVMALMQKHGAIKADGKLDMTKMDSLKTMFKDQKDLIDNINLVQKHINEANGQPVDRSILENAVVLRDANGQKSYFDRATGQRRDTNVEMQVKLDLPTVGQHAGQQGGRSLDQAVRDGQIVDRAVRSGIPIHVIFDQGGEEKDGAISAHLAQKVGAEDFMGQELAASLKNVAALVEGLQASDVAYEKRIKILSGLNAANFVQGLGRGSDGKIRYDGLSGKAQQDTQKILQEMMRLKEVIDTKKAENPAYQTSDMEKAILNQLETAQKTFRAHAEEEWDGNVKVTVKAGPRGITKIIHPES